MSQKKRLLRILAFVLTLTLVLSIAELALAYSTIPYGEQSNNVRKLQTALRRKGYYTGTVDGKFGPGTKKAVMKYQRSIGLHADGRPGDKTLTALYDGGSTAVNTSKNRDRINAAKPKNPRTLYYGCTGARVRALQRALSNVGCYHGSIDGKYGDLTYEAVKRYQSKVGLHSDGMAGAQTIASLNKKAKKQIYTGFVLDIGSKGTEVATLQNYLESNTGYLMPGSYTKGVYDQATSDAVALWKGNGNSSVTEKQYNDILSQPTATPLPYPVPPYPFP